MIWNPAMEDSVCPVFVFKTRDEGYCISRFFGVWKEKNSFFYYYSPLTHFSFLFLVWFFFFFAICDFHAGNSIFIYILIFFAIASRARIEWLYVNKRSLIKICNNFSVSSGLIYWQAKQTTMFIHLSIETILSQSSTIHEGLPLLSCFCGVQNIVNKYKKKYKKLTRFFLSLFYSPLSLFIYVYERVSLINVFRSDASTSKSPPEDLHMDKRAAHCVWPIFPTTIYPRPKGVKAIKLNRPSSHLKMTYLWCNYDLSSNKLSYSLIYSKIYRL